VLLFRGTLFCGEQAMSDPVAVRPKLSQPIGATVWGNLLLRAHRRLERRARRLGEMSPRRMAVTVLAVLPKAQGRKAYAWLQWNRWLDPAARLPCDVFDHAILPLSPGAREILRLAVFGLPGQGRNTDYKHREALYQIRCAEIMREARDLKSLAAAAQRALNHPEVRSDPLLAGMLRSYIAEREVEFAARARARTESTRSQPIERSVFRRLGEKTYHARERVRRELSKFRLLLEEDLAHYNVPGARKGAQRIEELRRRYPAYVEPEVVTRCREQVERLEQKLVQFREQLERLYEQGLQAAEAGQAERALWISRRIAAVHDMLPAVLPREQFERYHGGITAALQSVEARETARELLQQERIIAAEIKRLGAIVHRYHKFLRNPPADPQILGQARAEYEQAVEQVRQRDQEWLASVMLRLDALIGDLRDPTGKAGMQVDRFLERVRDALVHIRREIRAIQAEQAADSAPFVRLRDSRPPSPPPAP